MPVEAWPTVTEQEADGLLAEMRREISPGHVMTGRNASVIRRCSGCDDVIFRLDNEAFAVVHLTWSGREECEPFPMTVVLPSFVALESYVDSHGH